MTKTVTSLPPDERLALLRRAGLHETAVAATQRIDAIFQNWRRRISRRELGILALKDLAIPLNLAQLDVLVAIDAPLNEFGATAAREETMVGTVAERLNIDPSRASRIVGEMVDAGYVVRAVSQADARRAIIHLTAKGATVVAAVRTHKFLLLGDFLDSWSAEDLDRFTTLLERFSNWPDGLGERRQKYEEEIAGLAQAVQKEHEEPSS